MKDLRNLSLGYAGSFHGFSCTLEALNKFEGRNKTDLFELGFNIVSQRRCIVELFLLRAKNKGDSAPPDLFN